MADLTYAALQSSLARKRKMAEMLQQQAYKPMDEGLIPGAKISWASPLGSLMQQYASIKSGKDADEAESAGQAAADKARAAIMSEQLGTPGVDAKPIEQEATVPAGPPPAAAEAAPPLTAAFGPTGMPNVGPRDNELKGAGADSTQQMAQLLGGPQGPQLSPLAPPPPEGAPPPGPEMPPLLPRTQPVDMAGPGMKPKLSTDAILPKLPTGQDFIDRGNSLLAIGDPTSLAMGKGYFDQGIKADAPLSREDTARMAQEKELKVSALQEKAAEAQRRSEDTRLSIQQRADASKEAADARRDVANIMADARRDAAADRRAAAGATPKFGGPEGKSDKGNVVLRGKDGVAHEVVNGVPDPKPYAGPITSMIEQRGAIKSAGTGAGSIEDMGAALKQIESNPDAYGTMSALGEFAPNAFGLSSKVSGLNDEQLALRSNVQSMTANITHSLYGSAFSAGEQRQAKGFLIDPKDDIKQVKAKLKGRMELEQRHFDALPASAKAEYYARRGMTAPGDNKAITVDY